MLVPPGRLRDKTWVSSDRAAGRNAYATGKKHGWPSRQLNIRFSRKDNANHTDYLFSTMIVPVILG